jgi:hypothetical protein
MLSVRIRCLTKMCSRALQTPFWKFHTLFLCYGTFSAKITHSFRNLSDTMANKIFRKFPMFFSLHLYCQCFQILILCIVLSSSSNVIRMIKPRRMRWPGRVARMERRYDRILVGKPEGKRRLRRPRRWWSDNIKMCPREIEWSGTYWINLA